MYVGVASATSVAVPAAAWPVPTVAAESVSAL